MARIDKTSIRQEFDHIKVQIHELTADGKVSAELKPVLTTMIMMFELLISIFLEKVTPKSSKNSSLPPSQTNKDDTSHTGSHSKGKKEDEHSFSNCRTKEKISISKVIECAACGEDLTLVGCSGHERRTSIDIYFEKVVDHVDAEKKECPKCHSLNKGAFPKHMAGPKQYGSGVKAYILTLLVAQMIAFKRVQFMMKSVISEAVSEATMLKYILQLDTALEDWESQSISYLLAQRALHVDETSLQVNGKKQWIHVYSSGDVTLKLLHMKRGKEAIDEFNIIPRYGGAIIHDCWASYFSYHECDHGLCGSHLLRELTFVIDSNKYAWAKNMKKLLQETCYKVAKRKRKKLTTKEQANLLKRYRNILTRGQKELPPLPERPSGKRGRLAVSDAQNLWNRLAEHENAVLLFARDEYVSFTNNRAERDLRMTKVKQKISGCFKQPQYACAYCRISSYLQSMANLGYNPMIAIQLALAGKIPVTGE